MNALNTILSPRELKLLRLGYDGATAYNMALGSLAAPIPGAGPWVTEAGSYFFKDETHMSAKRRELCVLSMLTTMRAPDQLAIHVYWGLMVGLTVDEVCDALFLGGDYAGIAAFNIAIKTAGLSLASLHQQAEAASVTIDTQVAASPGSDPKAIRAAACKQLLPVQIVVPSLAVYVARGFAGVPSGA